jgi:hypothetical protein
VRIALATLLLGLLAVPLVVVQIGEAKLCRGTRFVRFFHDAERGYGVEYEYDCAGGVKAAAEYFPFAPGVDTSLEKCPGSGA